MNTSPNVKQQDGTDAANDTTMPPVEETVTTASMLSTSIVSDNMQSDTSTMTSSNDVTDTSVNTSPNVKQQDGSDAANDTTMSPVEETVTTESMLSTSIVSDNMQSDTSTMTSSNDVTDTSMNTSPNVKQQDGSYAANDTTMPPVEEIVTTESMSTSIVSDNMQSDTSTMTSSNDVTDTSMNTSPNVKQQDGSDAATSISVSPEQEMTGTGDVMTTRPAPMTSINDTDDMMTSDYNGTDFWGSTMQSSGRSYFCIEKGLLSFVVAMTIALMASFKRQL